MREKLLKTTSNNPLHFLDIKFHTSVVLLSIFSAINLGKTFAPPYRNSFFFLVYAPVFWGIEFSRAFSHHHHSGDSCLSASERGPQRAGAVLKGSAWRLGNVKSFKAAAHPVFVWNVFLFAPSLQKRAATYPLRDTLERMFRQQAPKADKAKQG